METSIQTLRIAYLRSDLLREYGGRLSDFMREAIQNGAMDTLPFNFQTKNVSGYNRFLPGSLVVFEVVDFRVFSLSNSSI